MYQRIYNIHNILTVKFTSTKKLDLGKRLGWIYLGESNALNFDISMKLGDFTPTQEDCVSIAHRYYVCDNYFRAKERGKIGSWEVEILGFERGNIEVNINVKGWKLKTRLFPGFVAHEFLLPLIERKLLENDYLFLHAGGAAKGSGGALIIGRSGSYKTTIIMDLIRRYGFTFLGDERVIVGPNRKCYSFPTIPFYFEYKLENEETEDISSIKRLIITTKYITKGSYSPSFNITPKSTFDKVILISRKKVSGSNIHYTELDLDTATEKIYLNNLAEYIGGVPTSPIFQFYKYILVYSIVYPENRYIALQEKFKKLVREYLKDVPIYEVHIPQKYSPLITEAINKLITGE